MQHTFEAKISKLFAMSDETWARHANPLSVWSRFTVLPLVIISIWSRVWIEYWSWLPIALSVLWIWINPRIFPKPLSTDNWASKAVIGERVWINRKSIPVPKHHRLVPNLLSSVSALGLPFLIWGLWQLKIWPILVGMILVYAGKVWFLDRMVWLYEDMKNSNEEYAQWLYHEKPNQRMDPAQYDAD